MQCTFEIFLVDRLCGRWIECAIVDVRNPDFGTMSPVSVDYDINYAFTQTAPLSLRHTVNVEPIESSTWPPFLFDLIPQGHGRKYLLGELEIKDNPAADWALLCAGAFNPIGRLRIKEAVEYYKSHLERTEQSLVAKGFSIEDILERDEEFIEHLQIHGMLSSGTSGVQGVAPKFLITLGKNGLWYADGALPDDLAAKHYIVKLPRGKDISDKKVLRNEAAYMTVAKEMGLHVEELPILRSDMLFIPRFDRTVMGNNVHRHHQESASSLAGQIGFEMRPSQYKILEALRKFTDDPTSTTIEFLKRDVMNLALGNTDNHGRNTAVQTKYLATSITPLFDFAPMYLDKEGIPRALRWRTPDKVEQTNWFDVLEHLTDQVDIGAEELSTIRKELFQFSTKMESLEDVMKVARVDDDIISRRHHDICSQIQQLQELDSARRIIQR